jgi:hypothetical protein
MCITISSANFAELDIYQPLVFRNLIFPRVSFFACDLQGYNFSMVFSFGSISIRIVTSLGRINLLQEPDSCKKVSRHSFFSSSYICKLIAPRI